MLEQLDTEIAQDVVVAVEETIEKTKNFLYEKGISRFDTDTAKDNIVAQHYYEKNNFTREGVTRSYYKL